MEASINYAPKHLKGKKVRIGRLKATTGFLVAVKHLVARRENSNGTFLQYVPGHGGDVVAVQHPWGCAVYGTDEFKFIKRVKSDKKKLPRKLKKRRVIQVQALNGDILNFKTWDAAFPVWVKNRSYMKTLYLRKPLLKNPIIKPEHLERPTANGQRPTANQTGAKR